MQQDVGQKDFQNMADSKYFVWHECFDFGHYERIMRQFFRKSLIELRLELKGI